MRRPGRRRLQRQRLPRLGLGDLGIGGRDLARSGERAARGNSTYRGIGADLAFVPVPEPVLAVGVEGVPGGVLLFGVRASGRLGTSRYLTIGSPGIVGLAGGEAGFGRALAASNDLLVIGAPSYGPRAGSGAVQPVRVQRTGEGLRLHPGRLLPHETGLSEAASWVARLCPGRYGLLGGPGRVPQPFGSARGCGRPELGSGSSFAIVRTGTGRVVVDAPAVLSGNSVILGWPPDQETRATRPSPKVWLPRNAELAAPAA